MPKDKTEIEENDSLHSAHPETSKSIHDPHRETSKSLLEHSKDKDIYSSYEHDACQDKSFLGQEEIDVIFEKVRMPSLMLTKLKVGKSKLAV